MAASGHKDDPKWHAFVYSSASAMTAVCFTNPLDVAKVRLQLQGEVGSKCLVILLTLFNILTASIYSII